MTKHIVYFHSADFDGICGGKIIEKWLTEEIGEQAEMRPINYNEDPNLPEDLSDYTVYMVDFSLDPDYMIHIRDNAKQFIWCDHHITAIKNSEDFGYDDVGGLRDVKLAGCELAWNHLFAGQPMPYPVELCGRYDVWDHKNPDTLYFQYGARYMLGKVDRYEFWKNMLSQVTIKSSDGVNNLINLRADSYREASMMFMEVISTGKIIYDYQTSSDAKVAKSLCYEVDLEGHKFIATNRSHVNSNFFNGIYDPKLHAGMLRYHKLRVVGIWSVSLYTTGDVDMSAIAKKYGGGGHKQAAGFTLTTNQLHRVLP